MRSRIVLFSSLVALGCSGSVLAQSTGFYGGIGVGQSKGDLNDADFAAAVGETASIDDTDTAWKFFAGYKFTPNISAELGYAKLGEFTARYADAAGAELFTDKYEASSWNLSAVGTMPISGAFSVLGKLGLTRNEAEISSSDSSGSTKKTKTGLLWGIGAQYDVNQRVSVRLEYEDFGKFGNEFTADSGTGRADINMFSLSLIGRF